MKPKTAEDRATVDTHHPSAFNHEDLQRFTGYQRPADIERWCQQNGVRYFRGRIGIWTTLDAVNAALGIGLGEQPPTQRIEF
ncbi:hypothetical protein [Thiorhodococcus fuscus]|uniref:DUF4224 domain-containing protein n=1 Tax=Thiorhodococcus fuscus TaxID=527200 RepID=A0ABW4Y8Q1_9GAMM